MRNWLIVHDLEAYEENSRMLGYDESTYHAGEIQPRDRVIYYLKKNVAIKGIYKVCQKPWKRDKKWSSPIQIEISPMVELAGMLDFKKVIKKLELFRGAKKWQTRIQGKNAVRELSQKDFSIIQEYIKNFMQRNELPIKMKISKLIKSLEQDMNSQSNFDPSNIDDNRRRIIASIVRRRGQPEFRRRMLAAYGGKCAISGDNAEQSLEAVHVISYKGEKTNNPTNGILLRADLHTLFDLRLLTIDNSNMTVVLSPELQKTTYCKYKGKKLNMPRSKYFQPNKKALEIHRHECGF